MRFVKCTVTKPSLFDNRSLEFERDITVVNGKNGSGKSFLARTMIEGIWKYFSGNCHWLNGAWEDMYLDLGFSVPVTGEEESFYRFRYQMGNLSIFSLSGGEREVARFSGEGPGPEDEGTAGAIAGEPALAYFMEGKDLTGFINASFIPSPSDLDSEKVLDYDRIKDIILGDCSGFYEKYGLLRERYRRDEGLSGHLFEMIEEYSRRLAELNKEIELRSIKSQRFEKLEKERNIIEEEIQALDEKRSGFEERRDILKKIRDDMKKIEDLNRELESIRDEVSTEQEKVDRVRGLEEEINLKFIRFKRMGIGDERNLDKLQDVFRDIINLNEEIDSFYLKREGRRRKARIFSMAASVAALSSAFFILYHNGFSIEKGGQPLGWILGFTLLFTTVMMLYSFVSGGAKKLAALNERKAELEERLKRFLKEGNLQLDDYKLSELYEMLLQYFEEYIDYTDCLEEMQQVRSTLKDAEYLKKIHRDLKNLKKKEEGIQKEIQKNVKSIDLTESMIQDQDGISSLIEETLNEIKTIDGMIKGKQEVISRIDAEKQQPAGQSDGDAAITGERDSVKKLLSELQDRKSAVMTITDIMMEAVSAREKQQLKKLVDETLMRFHTVTDNQFAAKVDDRVVRDLVTGNGLMHDLNPSVVHALLLSVKFSLTGFLSDSAVSLPLIIDDPFLFMDDERVDRLKDQIRDIARYRQVIVFTHHTADKDWGKIIEL